MQTKNECFICGTTEDLETHHIFYGTANRKKSEQYKTICTVRLCHRHHNEPPQGAHFNKTVDLMLKQMAQTEFEKIYDHDLFIREFGKNWL